jgi:endonuclease YncB( thermonuclease family)
VQVARVRRDFDGRLIGEVYADGINVGDEMLAKGYAVRCAES